MAVGALDAALSAGLRVPDDLALVGFDDLPISQHARPSLTTVHVPVREIGAVAAGMLIDMIEAGQRLASQRVGTKLIARESSGAPLKHWPASMAANMSY